MASFIHDDTEKEEFFWVYYWCRSSWTYLQYGHQLVKYRYYLNSIHTCHQDCWGKIYM